MPTSRLRWLQIHAYEQFEPVRIEFSARENLLLGINGAGKTRLLKLIHAVLTLDFRELLDRPFDVEFEIVVDLSVGDPEMVLSGRVRHKPASQVSEADESPVSSGLSASIHYRDGSTDLQYDVKGQEFTYRLVGSSSEWYALREHLGVVRPARRDSRKEPLRGILFTIETALQANFLGESDQQARELTEEIAITFSPPARYALRAEGTENPFVIRDIIPLVFRLASSANEQGFRSGIDLATFIAVEQESLRTMLEPLGVTTVHVLPNVVGTTEAEIECRGVGLKAMFHGGAALAHSRLTFGQRRYLYAGIVFMFHASVPVLVDEIDNGMHPRLVENLLNMWRERQLFLVSHNKMVIDYTNFSGPQDVQEKIHIVQRDAEGRQRVSVLDAETAREVYAKIEVAIQNPSDVLRAEGLW